tara:strand:- start:31985 stop:32437 length:453 start_codon:yes stop_codon:yes gene_type:complete
VRIKPSDNYESNYYPLWSSSFQYELDITKDLRITVREDIADLTISHVNKDGDVTDLTDDHADYWLGAVLYWHDAMASKTLHRLQISAIARLARWLQYVPTDDYIAKYAMPSNTEVLSYHEQIDLLAKDGFDFAVRLKAHRNNYKNAEGAD